MFLWSGFVKLPRAWDTSDSASSLLNTGGPVVTGIAPAYRVVKTTNRYTESCIEEFMCMLFVRVVDMLRGHSELVVNHGVHQSIST